MPVVLTYTKYTYNWKVLVKPVKGKAVPLQAWSGTEGSRKLRFADFMISALRTGRLYPQEIHLVLVFG
jgi:hypothetical protein